MNVFKFLWLKLCTKMVSLVGLRYLGLLFLLLNCQNFSGQDAGMLSTNISPPIAEMVGVCAGPNVDGFIKAGKLPGIIPHFRYFYLQEKDFPGNMVPAAYLPPACPFPCDNYTCWNENESPFADNKYRLCNLEKSFQSVTVAWEAINVKGKNRHWPDKWFAEKEWGSDIEDIKERTYQYTTRFLETMCPQGNCIIDVLEVGNEPWGLQCPGQEAYFAIQEGVIEAFKAFFASGDPNEWGIKLSTAAFQAKQTRNNLLDGIEAMVPKELRPYYHYISLHAYARDKNGRPNASPIAGGDLSFFNRIKNLENWRRQHMPHAKINLTEFGWNSSEQRGVGERLQINYLLQALLIAQRFGIHRTFIYELEDQPKVDQYNSMGLYENGNHQPKPVYFALEKFLEKYGNLHFVKVIEENASGFEYEFQTPNKGSYRFKGEYSTGEIVDNEQGQ